jgi:hypothetical protein
LQYINLSYDIEKNNFKELPFKNCKLYVIVNNLGLLWKANKDGIDPDYKGASLPPSKNYALGITANF